MDVFNLNQVNRLILQKQYLTEVSKTNNIVQIAEDICGLHSTDLKTSYLSLFNRTKNFKKIDLEKELYINKSLGRIRGMRRTLFIQPKNMIPIVHNATFNLIEKSFEKYMEFHKVGLKEFENISHSILKLLKGKELSASEVRKELNSKANIPAIIAVMCNKRLLIRARPIKDWKDRRNKYAIFTEYFPDIKLEIINEKKAIQYLVEKYIKSFGPVTINDISWWTGLTKSKIKEALKNIEVKHVKIEISTLKGEFIMNTSDLDKIKNINNSEKPTLSLLPILDPYPMGYKDRDRYIEAQHFNKVFDRSGNITSTVILDGRVIGVWDVEIKPEKIMKLYLFHSITNELQKELVSKAKKIGKFYFDEEVDIKKCKTMTILTERNAGGFMSPLKNS